MDLPVISPIDRKNEPGLRARIAALAKPPGSLGRIEELAVQLALIQARPDPRVGKVTLLLFAGDHGLLVEGVSRYPASVTAAMVQTFLAERATVNAFARAVGADLIVVDAGMAEVPSPHYHLIDANIRRGSRNAAVEPAMTGDETRRALSRGASIARAAVASGADAIAVGEMGIGNSSSAALIAHRLVPAPLDECVGQGAGQDAAGMIVKRAALAKASARTYASLPLDVLSQFGGYEIAMIAGAILGAAARRAPVIVDGFIASAAALVAIRMRPDAAGYCVFAHRSADHGHAVILYTLGATPLLDLGMRLGEGTGALLAVPLLRAAAALFTEVATLHEVMVASQA